MENHSRRKFMKQVAVSVAAVPFASLLGGALSAFAKDKKPSPLPPGQNAVAETDPVASAIGYRANVKDIDYTKYPQRKKPEAKNQDCKSCSLYVAVNEGWGKCQMLTSGVVAAEGWCGSWSKKSK